MEMVDQKYQKDYLYFLIQISSFFCFVILGDIQ